MHKGNCCKITKATSGTLVSLYISRELTLTVDKHIFAILSTSLKEGVWDFPVKYQRKNGFELYIHIYEVNLRTFWGEKKHGTES